MPLWGKTAASDENKPKYLSAADANNTFATSAGWVLRQPDGTEELLVTMTGLPATLAAPNITGTAFASSAYTASAASSVGVFWDEQLATTIGTPTIALTYSGGTNPTAATPTRDTAGNGVNWVFTVPAYGGVITASATGGGTLVNGTYTNVGSAGVTNSGGGSGARFTVVVAGGAITSVTQTTAGTAYVAASTDTIAAASWAGGDADLVIAVDSLGGTLTLAAQTIGSGTALDDITGGAAADLDTTGHVATATVTITG